MGKDAEKIQELLCELPPMVQRSLRKCWAKEITGPFRLPKRESVFSTRTQASISEGERCATEDCTLPKLVDSDDRSLRKLADCTVHQACTVHPAVNVSDPIPDRPFGSNCDGAPCAPRLHRTKSPAVWLEHPKVKPETKRSSTEDISYPAKEQANHASNSTLKRQLLSYYSQGPAAVGSLPSSVTRRPVLDTQTSPRKRCSNRSVILLPYTKDLLCNWSPSEESKIDALLTELQRRWERDGASTGWLARKVPGAQDPADLEPDFPTFADLGCGDGRVVLSVSRKFPGSRCIGVDLNSELIAAAATRAEREGVSQRCEFKTEDVSLTDLSCVSVVFMHLPKPAVRYVVDSVLPRSGLKPGAIIFSADSQIPEDITSCKDCQISGCTSVGLSCYTWLGRTSSGDAAIAQTDAPKVEKRIATKVKRKKSHEAKRRHSS